MAVTNGVRRLADGYLLRAGYVEFPFDELTEAFHIDVPVPALVLYDDTSAVVHHWTGAAWEEVAMPANPDAPFSNTGTPFIRVQTDAAVMGGAGGLLIEREAQATLGVIFNPASLKIEVMTDLENGVSGAPHLPVVTTTALAAYDIAFTDYIVAMTNVAARAVTLPNSEEFSGFLLIKDGAGTAALAPITISAPLQGGQPDPIIDGEASIVIAEDYGWRLLVLQVGGEPAVATWHVVGSSDTGDTAVAEHLAAFAHGDIEHTNRAQLNQVTDGDHDVRADNPHAVTAAQAGAVPTGRTVTAGAGLTGGGDLSLDRTLDVAANADGSIVVNANDVQVGVLATDAQHGVRGGGTQHAAATEASPGFSEIATQAEVDTGTDDQRIVPPLKLASRLKALPDTAFGLVDADDANRILQPEVPATLINNGVPQARPYILRENIPDFANLAAPESSNFTAQWGSAYRVDATAGSIIVTIPNAAAANSDWFIQIHRVDTSANTVTVYTGQAFFDFSPAATVNAIRLNPGRSVNIRSIGTVPVVTDYNGINSAYRLWQPDDAGSAPVVWYRFRDLATLTLTGALIEAITNQGTLGAGFNLIAHDAASRPTLVNNLYGDFVPTRSLRTAASQATMAGTSATVGAAYLKNNNASDFLFCHQLTSRFSAHLRWSGDITYIDMPIVSRYSGNIASVITGANPKSAVMRKGSPGGRQLFIDGRTTASLSAIGAGTALAGSGFFALGSDIDNIPAVSGGFDGRIYEWVAYNTDLTDADRDRLAAYLLWGIGSQAELNAQSPYTTLPPLIIAAQY